MSVSFYEVTIATPGTPQQLSKTLLPSGPTITMGGITSVAGGATQAFTQISIQAAPSNTATKSVFVGGPSMNRTTLVGVGAQLLPGASTPPIGQHGGAITLDDIWIDTDSTNAATEKVLLILVG